MKCPKVFEEIPDPNPQEHKKHPKTTKTDPNKTTPTTQSQQHTESSHANYKNKKEHFSKPTIGTIVNIDNRNCHKH